MAAVEPVKEQKLETNTRRRLLMQFLARTAGQPTEIEVKKVAIQFDVHFTTIYADLAAIRKEMQIKLTQRDPTFWVMLANATFESAIRELHGLVGEAEDVRDQAKLVNEVDGLTPRQKADVDIRTYDLRLRSVERRQGLFDDIVERTDRHIGLLQRFGVLPKAPDKLQVEGHVDTVAVQFIVDAVLRDDPEGTKGTLDQMRKRALEALPAGDP